MYLKALEIQGFKSFPDKTRLTFEQNITAIVGPNGSGKSNLSDALLWVMGEQRNKSLRSSKMEDVIFGGTEKRSKLGFAQVSLVLDNSDHIFDYDASEVMLTRRYYRSGDSEYFINKEACRLKDLHSMLMDTGLGRDGYSIIGQGRIAEIVSNKSTDRREVFEEAAGISRFRYRKEEAERKLEKTEENLVRITDKLDELELQVGPLQKQAEVAKKYLVLRDELRTNEISVWMATLDNLRDQTEKVKLEYEQLSRELDYNKDRVSALYASSESISERMHRKDVENEEARGRQQERMTEASGIEAEIAVLRTNIEHTRSSVLQMNTDIEQQLKRAGEIENSIHENDARIAELKAEQDRQHANVLSATNMVDGCRMKIQGRETTVNDLTERANKLAVEVRSVESRIHLLSEMEKDYEGYSRAVKVVMKEAARGTIKGIHGPVANLIGTDKEYSTAIEIALGGAAQNIVVDDQNCGRIAIEMLKRQDAGRSTFLPLDTIQGSLLKELPTTDPGYVGLAYDLVEFDPKYDAIVASILGKVVIVEEMSDAIRISRKNNNRLKLVTLDGQVINPGGSMTGGSLGKSSGFISRANDLAQLKKDLVGLQQKAAATEDNLTRARQSLAQVRDQLEGALEEQSRFRTAEAAAQTEISSIEKNTMQLQVLYTSLSGDSDARKRAADAAEEQIKGFEARLEEKKNELASVNEKLTLIKEEIRRISDEKLELEQKRTNNDKEAQAGNDKVIDLERRVARAEQRRISAEMEESSILNKLWDSYELSYDTATSLRQPIENMAASTKKVSELKRQISALGNPNIGAIEEYERVSTRYEFFKTQSDDILKAKKELTDILRDITEQMKTVFTDKFNEIDETFRQTFLELFGGGKAALILEDPENVLECGIEIKVQPPGKAVSTMTLLSGGEKAFVAIALYFAILKVRPTPFCVMDEIEAALDENNVTKFAEYMRRMSDHTQFLVITHRRGTMEEADALYGVTMQEKGVSTVIPLDIESARISVEAT